MATEFSYEQNFAASPDVVFSMLTNPDYVRRRCDETGSMETYVEVTQGSDQGAHVASTRVLPAEVPAAARSLVGETITAKETQVWSPAGADGTRTASVRVEFSGPLTFVGFLKLTSNREGARVMTTGAFTASIPFVGGVVESMAAEQTKKYLQSEESIAAVWLEDESPL